MRSFGISRHVHTNHTGTAARFVHLPLREEFPATRGPVGRPATTRPSLDVRVLSETRDRRKEPRHGFDTSRRNSLSVRELTLQVSLSSGLVGAENSPRPRPGPADRAEHRSPTRGLPKGARGSFPQRSLGDRAEIRSGGCRRSKNEGDRRFRRCLADVAADDDPQKAPGFDVVVAAALRDAAGHAAERRAYRGQGTPEKASCLQDRVPGSHALRGNPVFPTLCVGPGDPERRWQLVPTQSVGTRAFPLSRAR
jgi:hypothetical protein